MTSEVTDTDYADALVGQRIVSVDLVTDGEDYILIRTEDGHALYADAPTLYAPDVAE